jgi:hypothetical protein
MFFKLKKKRDHKPNWANQTCIQNEFKVSVSKHQKFGIKMVPVSALGP